jgi:endoglucanase
MALALSLALVSSLAAAEPVKLASAARFDLSADARAGSIEDGQIIAGNGSSERMNWVAESDRPRGYTVNFPITNLGWRSLSVRFVPARNGTVTLTLMGPFEEASKGVVYRQEVLWDDLRAEGTALAHGGFEWPRAEPAAGWQSKGGVVIGQTSDVAAVEGAHYARTWHNQTLSATLDVTGGRAVTIRLNARAVRIKGPRDMKPIAGRSTPAHLAVRRFQRGANLGNDLEVPPGQNWAVHHTPDDLRIIRAQGFDHVRIPIGWHHYTGPGPEYRIQPAFFERADKLVNAGLREGLGVLINIHHFDDFTSDPQAQTPKFIEIWQQVAQHYARSPSGLALELLNEPKDAATTEIINPIFAETIQQIRRIDPQRTIFVGPGRWNSISELPKLWLPDDDQNLIVTVHNYDPFYFTHQGADWTGPDTKLTGILFPGPPPSPLAPDPKLKLKAAVLDWVRKYNKEPAARNPSGPMAFQGSIDQAKEWSEYYGRPIYIGEFGCYTAADPASRAHYYSAFRQAAEQAKLGWAIWDWKAGFHYWDEKTHSAEPGMHEALFGRSESHTMK